MNETTKRSQKKALFFSALAMILSFTMLLGTTYAWFTDSVVSSGNRIQSGKLQVGLEYRAVGTDGTFGEWKDANGAENILDPEALYEPGYVSMTLLKVENKGTLALKYQLAMVKEAAEKTAVNVDGNTFKLSDYLVFKFVKLDETTAVKASDAKTKTTFTREDALALVGADAPMGLNVQTTVDAVLADSDTEPDYVALVITMPETVGNAAMYDPDKSEAPQLKLDFKLVATQYSYEKDSFDEYYDQKAYNADWNVYQTLKGDISKGLSAYDKDGDEQNRYEVVTVTGTKPNNVTLRVAECNAPVGLPVQAGTTYKSYDISVKDDNGNTPADTYTVKMFIGKDWLAEKVKLYHNMDEIAEKTYDAATGYVTFTTTTFSPFTAVVAGVAAKVDGTYYPTFKEAFDVARASSGTVQLMAKEIEIGETLKVNGNEKVTVDLNGCTLKATSEMIFQNYGEFTITDNSPKTNGVVTTEGTVRLDENVGNNTANALISNAGVAAVLNLDKGKIVVNALIEGPYYYYVIHNSSGIVNFNGADVVVNARNTVDGSRNVFGVFVQTGTVNMTAGSISVQANAAYTCAIYTQNDKGNVNISGGTIIASSQEGSKNVEAIHLGSTEGTVSIANATIEATTGGTGNAYGIFCASNEEIKAVENSVIKVTSSNGMGYGIHNGSTKDVVLKEGNTINITSASGKQAWAFYDNAGVAGQFVDATGTVISPVKGTTTCSWSN